jgi:alanyl-tRNA synthetase
LFDNAVEESGVKILTGTVIGAAADVLRDMCEKARDKDSSTVVVLASANDGKVTFAAACGKDALARGANAGRLVKAVAQAAGGNGGGKPDMAMAGAKDAGKIEEALAIVKDAVLGMLK